MTPVSLNGFLEHVSTACPCSCQKCWDGKCADCLIKREIGRLRADLAAKEQSLKVSMDQNGVLGADVLRLRQQLAAKEREIKYLSKDCPQCLGEGLVADSKEGGLLVKCDCVTVRKQERDKLKAELAAAKLDIERRQNEEASVCPEDVGIVEYVQSLRQQFAEQQEKLAQVRDVLMARAETASYATAVNNALKLIESKD